MLQAHPLTGHWGSTIANRRRLGVVLLLIFMVVLWSAAYLTAPARFQDAGSAYQDTPIWLIPTPTRSPIPM